MPTEPQSRSGNIPATMIPVPVPIGKSCARCLEWLGLRAGCEMSNNGARVTKNNCGKKKCDRAALQASAGQQANVERRCPGKKKCDRAPTVDARRPGVTQAASSSQATPRHRPQTGYRCSLSGLAGFTGAALRGTQPSSPLTWVRPQATAPRAGVRPGYGGLPVQGTASPPPSTVTLSVYPPTGTIATSAKAAPIPRRWKQGNFRAQSFTSPNGKPHFTKATAAGQEFWPGSNNRVRMH